MIQINICITEERCELEAVGHAWYAPSGQDVVCAAVSALICTLSLCDGVESRQGEGYLRLFCRASESLCFLFRVFASGLAEIAQQYPAYVSLKWGDYKPN